MTLMTCDYEVPYLPHNHISDSIMSSTGYCFAKVYADWVSQNQRQVAMLRLGDSLSKLCECRFLTGSKWALHPMLYELLAAEESSDDIFDVTLPLRKKETIAKYMGEAVADSYEDRFGLHHDPHQIIARIKAMLWNTY